MRARKDQTGVPNTCQYIDDIIDTLKIYVTDDDELNEAVRHCESIRLHNSTLRDFGNDTYYELEELVDRVDDLKYEIENLREEIDNYEDKLENALDEIYELKSELEDLKLSKYND